MPFTTVRRHWDYCCKLLDSECNCEAPCAGEVCESKSLLGGLDGVADVQPPRAVLTQLGLSPAPSAGAMAPASPCWASWPGSTWYRAAQPGWRLLAGRSCCALGLSTGTAAVWGPSPSTSRGQGHFLRSAHHADCQRWFCSLVSAANPQNTVAPHYYVGTTPCSMQPARMDPGPFRNCPCLLNRTKV